MPKADWQEEGTIADPVYRWGDYEVRHTPKFIQEKPYPRYDRTHTAFYRGKPIESGTNLDSLMISCEVHAAQTEEEKKS